MSRLTALRQSLGFSVDEVALVSEVSKEEIRRIEHDPEQLSDELAGRLSRIYGQDVLDALDDLDTGDAGADFGSPMATLLKANAEVLDATSRFAISEAVWIARRIRQIRQRWDEPSGWDDIRRFRSNPDYSHPRNGNARQLARIVRERLDLGQGPIASVQSDVLAPLRILVLCVSMPEGPDGQAFAEPDIGGVVLLNVASSANRSVFGRRVTLAHELAHLLFDRSRMRDMSEFCQFEARDRRSAASERESIERRARAFAVVLLAPFESVRDEWQRRARESKTRRVRALMTTFGLGYDATRWHLHNIEPRLLDRFETLPGRVDPAAPGRWEAADPIPCVSDGRLEAVPVVCRGALLETLREAWSRGVISEQVIREELGISMGRWATLRPAVLAGREARRWLPSSARSD